jgi:hypothetical protein
MFSLSFNPKVYSHIHIGLPVDFILSQVNTVHTLTSHFFKGHLNVTLQFMPRDFKQFLSFRFEPKFCINCSCLPHTIHACFTYLCEFIIVVIIDDQNKSWSSSACTIKIKFMWDLRFSQCYYDYCPLGCDIMQLCRQVPTYQTIQDHIPPPLQLTKLTWYKYINIIYVDSNRAQQFF